MSGDAPGPDSEIALKRAELALKVKEFEAKREIERRQLWFSSPLVVGVFSTIFGLIGTGLGIALQGYWNTALERQKFESTLIQKALESSDKIERSKNLAFLVDIGAIT